MTYKILTPNGEIESDVPGVLAGYKKKKIFGTLDCRSGMKMRRENRVFFRSYEDAVSCGYRPCKNCRPVALSGSNALAGSVTNIKENLVSDEKRMKALGKKKEEPLENQLTSLRSKIKLLESDNLDLRKRDGDRREFYNSLSGAVQTAEPLPVFRYRGAAKKSTPIVPVFMLSDWHIGEVVKPSETEGFNEYSWEIAQRRAYSIVEDFLHWVEVHRSFYRINECVIFSLADYVSGDIHDELKATNEFPLPVQTAKAGLLLGEIFRIIAPHFKSVAIYEEDADNHGRLQRKPQNKSKAANNLTYLVHTIANERAGANKNLNFIRSDGMKINAPVNGKNFLIEHGDTIRGWAGFPYYGMGRSKGKEAQRRMNGRGFDYWAMGHFHCPAIIEGNILVNGALSGTSEFDHSQGRHALPSQVAFLTHPKHGIFNWTAFTAK